MSRFIQTLAGGVTIGAVYALIAVGFSLVWATLRSLNFAHGDLYMLGAYTALQFATASGGSGGGWNPWLLLGAILPLAAIVGAVVSIATERAVFRPLIRRRAPPAVPILATLGVSLIIQTLVFLVFGPAFNSFPVTLPRGGFLLFGAHINWMQVGMILVTFASVLALHRMLTRTVLGTAMRAMSWDREVAGLMGINTSRLVVLAFAIAGVLAGIAGAFVGFYYGVITFFMGFPMAVKGFTAAVFGGFGNVQGALLGGLLLGISEATAASYFSGRWKDGIAFLILILVILFRPTGILGERLAAKV